MKSNLLLYTIEGFLQVVISETSAPAYLGTLVLNTIGEL